MVSVPSMTEPQLAREVRRLIGLYDVHVMHLTDARTAIGAAGMPDLILIGSEILWRELKSPYGRLDRQQVLWKYRLRAAGQDWDIWRPLDLDSGRIAQELQAIAPSWATP
jgi:hypothetical protein